MMRVKTTRDEREMKHEHWACDLAESAESSVWEQKDVPMDYDCVYRLLAALHAVRGSAGVVYDARQ